jgi:hypothetical protein
MSQPFIDITLTIQDSDTEGIYPIRMDVNGIGFVSGKFINPFHTAEDMRLLACHDRGVCSAVELKETGRILYNALFTKEFCILYQRALEKTKSTIPSRLRWKIKTSSAQILQLPWEALFDSQAAEGRGMFLNHWNWFELLIQTSAVAGSEINEITHEFPLKIVIAWAQPKGLADIYIERELHELEETFRPYIQKNKVELTILDHVTQSKLRTALMFPVHALHFIGHIQQDYQGKKCLAVENEDGGVELLAPADLLGTIGVQAPHLVFLNGCRTDTSPTQDWSTALLFLAAGSSTVIVNFPRMRSLHAILMARSFYEAWMVQPIESALSFARKTCLNELGIESQWYTARLFLHEGASRTHPAIAPKGLSESILDFLRTLDYCRVSRCDTKPQEESHSTIRSTNQATFAPRALARLLGFESPMPMEKYAQSIHSGPAIISPHCISILRLSGFSFQLGEAWAQNCADLLQEQSLHASVRLYRSRVRIWQGALTFNIEGTNEQIATQELMIPYTGPQLAAGEYVWTLQLSIPVTGPDGAMEFRSILLYSALRLLSPQEVTLYQDAVTGLAVERPIEAAALLRGAAADLYGFYDEAIKAYQQASASSEFKELANQLESLAQQKRSQGILSPEGIALLPQPVSLSPNAKGMQEP